MERSPRCSENSCLSSRVLCHQNADALRCRDMETDSLQLRTTILVCSSNWQHSMARMFCLARPSDIFTSEQCPSKSYLHKGNVPTLPSSSIFSVEVFYIDFNHISP